MTDTADTSNTFNFKLSFFQLSILVQVFWLKNDKMLDVKKMVGYIITNEGNLIISQAKLSDTGE